MKPKKPKEGVLSTIRHSFAQMKRSLTKQVPVDLEVVREKNLQTLRECLLKVNNMQMKYDNFTPSAPEHKTTFEAYKQQQRQTIENAMQEVRKGKSPSDFNNALIAAGTKLEANDKNHIKDNMVTLTTTEEIRIPASFGSGGWTETSEKTEHSYPKSSVKDLLAKLLYRQDRNQESNIKAVENKPEQEQDRTIGPS